MNNIHDITGDRQWARIRELLEPEQLFKPLELAVCEMIVRELLLEKQRDKWRFHANDLYQALQVQIGFEHQTATAQGAQERYEKAVADES